MKTLIEDLKKVMNSEIEDKDKYMKMLINGFLKERDCELLTIQGVVKSLKDKPTQTFDEFITGICKNRGITLINNYTKETIGLSTLIEKWKATNT